jgi:hypothetical protein
MRNRVSVLILMDEVNRGGVVLACVFDLMFCFRIKDPHPSLAVRAFVCKLGFHRCCSSEVGKIIEAEAHADH